MTTEVPILQELVDIVPGPPLRRTDRGRFFQALGITRETDSTAHKDAFRTRLLSCVGDAAYEMPLPPRWSEQVDVRGYIYFAHALKSDATWEHPLSEAFKEILELAHDILHTQPTLVESAAQIQKHLKEVQLRAAHALRGWSGPYKPPGTHDEYFFNEFTNDSSWESPSDVWQYELHARYLLLMRVLQCLHDDEGNVHERKNGVCQGRTSADSGQSAVAVSSLGDSVDSGDGCTSTVRVIVAPKAKAPSLEDTASSVTLLGSRFSDSQMSAAVRSKATDIASSLWSAPSFGANSHCVITVAETSGTTTTRASTQRSNQPRPPMRSPAKLRHLAAPPRMNDMLPDTPLHALAGTPGPTALSQRISFSGGSLKPPPPPGDPIPATRRMLRNSGRGEGAPLLPVVTPPCASAIGVRSDSRFRDEIPCFGDARHAASSGIRGEAPMGDSETARSSEFSFDPVIDTVNAAGTFATRVLEEATSTQLLQARADAASGADARALPEEVRSKASSPKATAEATDDVSLEAVPPAACTPPKAQPAPHRRIKSCACTVS